MQKTIRRRSVLGAGLATGAVAMVPARARAQQKPIRIGVLTDMTGVYAANTGPGSVLGARMAIEDFSRAHPALKVELVQADLQLKPDVALGIAADWYDNQGVDVVTDVPLSSAAFAIGDLAKAKDKVAIFTGGASADITGTHCGPNHLHWVYDTWSMPHGVVDAAVKNGGDTWFFITADYAFGHSLEKDAAGFVTAAGGKVLGQAPTPFPGTTDFSAFLVQAKASGAKVIGLANGGTDTVNCIKQAAEFGIVKGGQKVAGMLFLLHDVHGVGLGRRAGRFADGTILLEFECGDAGVRPSVRGAVQWRDAGVGACRAVFGGGALSEDGAGDWPRQGEGERTRGDRAYEGDSDRGSVVRQGQGADRRAGDPRHASVRGEVARGVEGAVGLLHIAADDTGGPGVSSVGPGGLRAGAELIVADGSTHRCCPGMMGCRDRWVNLAEMRTIARRGR